MLLLLPLESLCGIAVFNFVYDFSVGNGHPFQGWTISRIFNIILACEISHTFSPFLRFSGTLGSGTFFLITVCVSIRVCGCSINTNLNRLTIPELLNLILFSLIQIFDILLQIFQLLLGMFTIIVINGIAYLLFNGHRHWFLLRLVLSLLGCIHRTDVCLDALGYFETGNSYFVVIDLRDYLKMFTN